MQGPACLKMSLIFRIMQCEFLRKKLGRYCTLMHSSFQSFSREPEDEYFEYHYVYRWEFINKMNGYIFMGSNSAISDFEWA